MTFLPKTQLGWWAVGLAVAVPALFTVGTTAMNLLYSDIPAGGSIVADVAARPGLAISMLLGIGSGLAAGVCGLLAIIRSQERSLALIVATIVGLFLWYFILGELIGAAIGQPA